MTNDESFFVFFAGVLKLISLIDVFSVNITA